MLTKDDLKAISALFEQEFDKELHLLKSNSTQTKFAIDAVKNHLLDLWDEFKEEIKLIKKSLKNIEKDQKLVVNFFDDEYLKLDKRITQVETNLNLTVLN